MTAERCRAILRDRMYPQGQAPPQWRPPPQKSGPGCGTFILILFAVGIAGTLGFCVLVGVAAHESPEQRADRLKTEREIEAAVADAQAQNEAAQAVYKTKLRKACKLSELAPVFVLPDEDVRVRCQSLVRENLKVPGSGEFPNPYGEKAGLVTDDGCNAIYTSYVDAKNAFGVQVRTRFQCTFDPRTGNFSEKTVQ